MKALVWPVLVLSLLMAHVPVGMAQETIHIRLANAYGAQIDIGIGSAERTNGADTVEGTLTRQTDGTWTGEVQATVSFDQAMKGILARACPEQKFEGSQRLRMIGRAVSGFNSKVQTISHQSGTAAEFLVLAVTPAGAPHMSKGDVNCLSMYTYSDGSTLLPLNDSRWLPEAGYTIGLPRSGVLEYDDDTIDTTGLGAPLPVKALGHWKVRVERP
jgi:hypothetical protein